jgi:hypothetical protein
MADKKTIALTGRTPVKIKEDDWPLLASASHNDRHGAQIGNEPNRESDWEINVLEHDDGRRIVYAVYNYATHYREEHCAHLTGGELLDKDANVVAAINRVTANIEERLKRTRKGMDVFPRLAHECIADLPAEELV